MITTDFLRQLDRFSLIVNKRITSNYVGERFSKATGKGLVFKDHLKYEPGEDFRSIDWRVFGRTDKLFVKRYEEERNLTVHVIMDYSGSMQFGSGISKAHYGGMLGIGFAYLALKNNEKFVMSTFANDLEVFKPKKGRSQLMAMVEFLNKKRATGLSKLEGSLSGYKKLMNSRSYVVVISDFLYPIEEIKRSLTYFKNQSTIFIQVLDKLERNLELEGDYKLKDLETGDTLRTFMNPYARKQYGQMLTEHIQKVKHACDEAGIQFYSFDTGMNVFDAFYEIVGKKR